MWKAIVMCISLFGSVALALAYGTRWIEPAALPMAAAAGLCLIGIVLIRAAPTEEPRVGGVVGGRRTSAAGSAPAPQASRTPLALEPRAVVGNELTS
jgi:hypothetical protein